MEHPRSVSLSYSLRYWLAVAALIPVWMVFAGFVAPLLIRELHAGNGPGFLVGLLGGRGQTPVENYLHAWSHAARMFSFVLALGALWGYLVMRLALATRAPASDRPAEAARGPVAGDALASAAAGALSAGDTRANAAAGAPVARDGGAGAVAGAPVARDGGAGAVAGAPVAGDGGASAAA